MPTTIYRNKAGKRLPSVTTIIGGLGWNREALMRLGLVEHESRYRSLREA